MTANPSDLPVLVAGGGIGGLAAALALVLTAFALAAFLAQQRVLGRAAYTTVSGKGDAGIAMALPAGLRRLCLGVALPWLAFTLVVYLFAFAGGFVPPRWWPMISPAAGVFGLGLLGGALLR